MFADIVQTFQIRNPLTAPDDEDDTCYDDCKALYIQLYGGYHRGVGTLADGDDANVDQRYAYDYRPLYIPVYGSFISLIKSPNARKKEAMRADCQCHGNGV